MPRVADPRSPWVSKLSGVHLFHFEGAPCAQRVRFALAEKGLVRGKEVTWNSKTPEALEAGPGTWVSRHVSLIKKQHMTPEYAEIQPNMVVPALVHDGRLYLESMDIIAYLDETWDPHRLLPTDPTASADVNQLVEEGKRLHVSVRYVSFRWGLGRLGRLGKKEEAALRQLEPESSPEGLFGFYSRFDRGTIDEATYHEHLAALEAGYAAMEQRLRDGQEFLTGASFTAADIIWSLTVFRILECGYPFAHNYPAVWSWFQRVSERPGFRNGVMERHGAMSRAFRVKSAIQNWLGFGLHQASSSPQAS